jgi:O-antigen/teichoic acid export membrane protein
MKTSIANEAVKLTISKTITMTFAIIANMILSRFRTLDEYGTYSQLLIVVNLATTIFMLGLPYSINFFIASIDDEHEKQKFISVYYSLTTVLSILTGLVLLINSSLIVSYFKNPMIEKFMYFFAIFPWTKIVLSSIDNMYIVYHKTSKLMVFKIVNSAILLTIVLFVEFFNLNFNAYLILYVIIESIFTLVVYRVAKSLSGKLYFSLNKNLLKRILKYSMPMSLAAIIGTINIELDKIIIGRFYSTEELAIYTNAARELPVTIVSSSLIAILMPHLAKLLNKDRNKEAISLWKYATSLGYYVICFLSIAFFVFAPELMSILYSSKYLPGVPVFRIYSLTLLLRSSYYGAILNLKGKTNFIFYSSIISLFLDIIMNYLFYILFGFIGPAISTLLSILLVGLFQLIATSKMINMSIKKIFPWKELGVITFINVFLGIIFYNLKEILLLESITGSSLEAIILGTLWSIIYIIIIYKSVKEKWFLLNVSKED